MLFVVYNFKIMVSNALDRSRKSPTPSSFPTKRSGVKQVVDSSQPWTGMERSCFTSQQLKSTQLSLFDNLFLWLHFKIGVTEAARKDFSNFTGNIFENVAHLQHKWRFYIRARSQSATGRLTVLKEEPCCWLMVQTCLLLLLLLILLSMSFCFCLGRTF